MDNNQLALFNIAELIMKEIRQIEGETYLLKLKTDTADAKDLKNPYQVQDYFNEINKRIKYLEGKFESYQKIIEIIKNKDDALK